MKQVYALLLGMLSIVSLAAQTTVKLDPEASELFKGVKSIIGPGEKNFIARKVGFILSGNKEQPFALDKDSKEYPFGVRVLPTDLNKDGKEEIFIGFGNSYTSGNTGSSIVAFIMNAAGVYEMNFGFPGMMPDVLATVNKGYPDLIVGGPGFEFPVFRWNGKVYDNYKKISDSDYGKTRKRSIEELSNEYQEKLK